MQKYSLTLLSFFIIMLLTIHKVDGFINELPLFNKVIYIDPGHGGIDAGASYKDVLEKDINLEISKLLVASLEAKGALVYLTREEDYDLAVPNAYLRKRSDLNQRARMINKSNCDLYLSIHLNASQSTNWSGAQVFYNDINPKNAEIAKIFQAKFKKHLGSKRKPKEVDDLFMYRNIKRPGVLLELGFISNPNERYILRKTYYQKKLVKVISEGVLEYFKN
jgi:N-acetylmuramoyl-L-alanine amidase